jgi:hypothetical protein
LLLVHSFGYELVAIHAICSLSLSQNTEASGNC